MITSSRIKCAAVVLVAAVMITLVLCHVHGINGPWYWKWAWRRLPAWRLYPAMVLAAAPFFAGQWLYVRRGRVAVALSLIALSTFMLQFAAISAQPPFGLNRLTLLIESRKITSYYTAARYVRDLPLRDWMSIYDRLLPQLPVHARFKPPGPVLYYLAMMGVFGDSDAAVIAGGIVTALLAAAAVPATYLLVKHFTQETDAAFCAASFMAFCPSLILFFPQFDQTYPALVCALLVAWSWTLQRGKLIGAFATGLVLAVMLLFSYFFLVLVAFMGTMTLLYVGEKRAAGFWRAAGLSLVVGAAVCLFYVAIWATLNFDPITTAREIQMGQAGDLVLLARPFPYHMPFDAIDLLLGTGWISGLLIAFYLASVREKLFDLFHHSPAVRLTFLALLQVVTVLAAAILPGEGARLFLPLMPLIAAVAGLELQRWPASARIGAYACLFVATCVICQNMTFLYAGVEIDGVAR